MPRSGYSEEYIFRAVQHYTLTGRFANGKSLDDQDAALYADMLDVMAMIAHEEWKIGKRNHKDRQSDDGDWRDEEWDDPQIDDKSANAETHRPSDITPRSRFNLN